MGFSFVRNEPGPLQLRPTGLLCILLEVRQEAIILFKKLKSSFLHKIGQASGTHRRRDQRSISNERGGKRFPPAIPSAFPPNAASHAAVVLLQKHVEQPVGSLNLKFMSILAAAPVRVWESFAAF